MDSPFGRLVLVAALDRDNAIGRATRCCRGTCPTTSGDSRQLTLGRPVVMGHRTAVSIGRALPGRTNLGAEPRGDRHRGRDRSPYGRSTRPSVSPASRELTVGGGGEVYALALPYATGMRLTWVDAVVAGADTWFPRFDPRLWTEVDRSHHDADDRHAYAFDWVDYVRARPSHGDRRPTIRR